MATLNVNLPKTMRKFVERQSQTHGFGTSGEYVKQLIREAQQTSRDRRLAQTLLQSVESLERGEGVVADSAWWRRKERQLVARHRKASR